ncbi:MAG: PaaI family thioesterase [Hyphomicrobiaceae bacterium]
MTNFTTPDPDYAARVVSSFARQNFARVIGASLLKVGPGEVDILLQSSSDLSQQHGYVHGGVLTSIADTASGYSAMTLTPPGYEVLTVELKVNFLRPARGDQQIAQGRVVKVGKTLTICSCDVYDQSAAWNEHVLTGMATMMLVQGPDR